MWGSRQRCFPIWRLSRDACEYRCATCQIDLLKTMFGKGLHHTDLPSRSRRSLPPPPSPPPPAKGDLVLLYRSPPFVGSWDEKTGEIPWHSALQCWSRQLNIPIKGIFSRNQYLPFEHSPCIINLDDLSKLGTHWVCCWRTYPGEYECFDSFSAPPPLEWELELENKEITSFLRNDNQLQSIKSVRCGYYCLLFLNERNRGKS